MNLTLEKIIWNSVSIHISEIYRKELSNLIIQEREETPWEYQREIHVRYVTKNGAVRIGKASWLFITTALAGKEIGFEELGNRIYRIYFRQFFLGYADMKELKVYDIMNYKNELKL